MTPRLYIVGSGKRVVETALPALGATDAWSLAGITSRNAKSISCGGAEHDVKALDALTPGDLQDVNLVYLVVAKHAVPTVLRRLGPLVPATCELLIETPVMLFKHLGHLGLLRAFRQAWVSEDCYTLPCWDPLRATGESFTSAHFDRCAYAYHGLAMARAVLGGDRVRTARATGDGRRVKFTNGRTFTTQEPRDYSVGRLQIEGAGLPIADHDLGREHRRLAALVEDEQLVGFGLDDAESRLSPAEASIVGRPGDGDGLFRWMDGMKRVGLLRLLEDLAAGRPGYPLEHALEDAVVDYWLHRASRYYASPLTDPRSGATRLGYRVLTKLVDALR